MFLFLVLMESWEASWASDFPLISASRRIHSLPQICPFCLRVLHGSLHGMRELQPLSSPLDSRGPATPPHGWSSHPSTLHSEFHSCLGFLSISTVTEQLSPSSLNQGNVHNLPDPLPASSHTLLTTAYNSVSQNSVTEV